MPKILLALALAASVTTACSSDAKTDCGDARAVAKKHKAAAEAAARDQVAPPSDPSDPTSAPGTVLDDAASSLIPGFDKLDSSSPGTVEARLYFAVVNGNPTCFGAEERAQVAVLSGRLAVAQLNG